MENNLFLNNCNCFTNGEINLWNFLKNKVNIIFDIGSRDDDYYFKDCKKEQQFHIFEPHPIFYGAVLSKASEFTNVFVNNVGIGKEETILPYYERAESFVNRFNEIPSKNLSIIPLSKYINDKSIENIDFLKIDTEGFELDVLQSLSSKLSCVKHIQFEYGGTYPDRGIFLKDIYDILKDYHIFIIGPNGIYSRPIPIEHLQYSNYLATKDLNEIKDFIKY
jgi:FkbM family methyltransferase